MDFKPKLDHEAEVPLYRQLFEQIAQQIRSGQLARGSRLPATRELAGLLGLNRTTVSAAYEILEAEGLISGQVGRGSFVTGPPNPPAGSIGTVCWSATKRPWPARARRGARDIISFAVSRPSRDLFPLDEFRDTCATVLARPDLADILQLGSPLGYEPLRRYLMEEARRQHVAGPGDDLLITNGCQQALDLIGRVLLRPGDTVAVEDPALHRPEEPADGHGRATGAASRSAPTAWTAPRWSACSSASARASWWSPRISRIRPGATLPLAGRRALLDAARKFGVPVIENDAYGELRYSGEPLPSLKQLDESGGTVLLRSFSKVSFPGLRVGWAVGPKPLIDRLRHSKEAADLHTDQLSQAVLLEFAESGRLEAHRARMLRAGSERLAATLEGCARASARRHALDAAGRRNESLGAAAGAARCGRASGARAAGRRDLPAGQVLRGLASRPGRVAVEFRGPYSGADPGGLAILGRTIRAGLETAVADFEPSPAMVWRFKESKCFRLRTNGGRLTSVWRKC